MIRSVSVLTAVVLTIGTACSAGTTGDSVPISELGVDTLPPVQAPSMAAAGWAESLDHGETVTAVVDVDRQLSLVDQRGRVSNTWMKWSALVAPDATGAVLTLPPATVRTLTSTMVTWVSLPDGEAIGELTVGGIVAEATATSLDGELVALTTLPDDPVGTAIAGGRDGTTVMIASRSSGLVYSTSLDGNFMAEAFSQETTADGVPANVFLLEYLPADAPTYYRVRVLDTTTDQVSPPLNLRDKSQTLDQQMAGYSRSHVVANDHGLLFTLYVGTDDPDAPHPFAFVHTLDFADGVWCLDIDPQLELTEVPGSLAVGGDRLYVASANGWVGSFLIPSITDPNLSPAMDWTVQAGSPGEKAPAITADDDGVYVSSPGHDDQLVHLRPDGSLGAAIELPGSDVEALAVTSTGSLAAIGAEWTTFSNELHRPEWLDDIAQVVS